ncbi:Serine/threonine-protein kinase 19 [Basidiobolus ranarum]|uniref:Serine/threonine-protein kinase 19 n=1 Tax=Basidiobolus ranarum TaxID=34480 RepID=A0ABR2WNL4_9FUNG
MISPTHKRLRINHILHKVQVQNEGNSVNLPRKTFSGKTLSPTKKPSGNALARSIVFDDALSAISHVLHVRNTKGHFKNSPEIPRVIMLHQLYSIVVNPTSIDKEIVHLCQEGKLRKLKIGDFQDEYGLMLMEDYIKEIEVVKEQLTASLKSIEFLDKFQNMIFTVKCMDVTITRAGLSNYMEASEEDITKLISMGFLTIANAHTFHFCVRNAGSFISNFVKGRREIMRTLKRRKYKELLEKQLEARKILGSDFSVKFHLLDLIGSGRCESIPTTSGELIKLTKKGLDET